MAKIYNEVVIDMNPESSTFEETLYEDSFEYSGDMMLAQYQANQFNEGDAVWLATGEMSDEGNEQYHRYTVQDGRWVFANRSAVSTTIGLSHPDEVNSMVNELPGNEFIVGYDSRSVEDRGLGMADVTAKGMLGKNEDEMLEWIIDTRYGGQLPSNITENDLLTQIRTKLPQKGEMTGTDWYGLQDTAGKIGGAGRSVYGGMSTGIRGQVAGQKAIGKDIYAIEEGKDKEWVSKFGTFLSGLPTATGT